MARKLAYTVHVRETELIDENHPQMGFRVGREETFVAGSVLPAWAAKCVGDHVYGDNEDDGQPAVAPNGSADDRASAEKPAGNASLEAWQEYAAAQGVGVEGKSRDEIRDQFA